MLPLTERRPKHLLNVGGVPFVEHQLAKLARAGIEHVVLATSYRAELFRPVLGDGERFGLTLAYIREDEPLGTAGAIRNAALELGDDTDLPVVILNGDVLSGHDLAAQLADFETLRDGRPVEVSLHLVQVPDARAFGCVPTDATGRVTAFVEKSENPVTNQVNAGCYIFRRSAIDHIPPGQVVSVERETFPAMVADDVVMVGYVENAYWRDVGSPEALVAASKDVVLGTAPSDAVAADPSGARVHPAAKVLGTVSGGSVVDSEATVEPGARVTGSVLMAGATVRAGAVVTDSVVGPGAVVGADAQLEGVTLGDESLVGDGVRLEPGSKLDCGASA